MKKQNKKITFKEIIDSDDGRLTIIENQIPFEIKRIYFIDKMQSTSLRGYHAHKELKQIIFCLQGSFELEFFDGKKSEQIEVKREGILIPPMKWHVMRNFSENCLICVLASDVYKESDYIRSFHEFKRLVK